VICLVIVLWILGSISVWTVIDQVLHLNKLEKIYLITLWPVNAIHLIAVCFIFYIYEKITNQKVRF